VTSEPLPDPSCPWFPLKALRLPKVKWCEEQLCSWIEEPANTWSNLGYILIGILMVRMASNLKSRPLRFYGPVGILVGFFSFVYHASNAFVLQLFDFLGMYLFVHLLIFVNLERIGFRVIRHSFGPYLATVAASTLITFAVDFTSFPIQGLILLLILAVIALEAIAIKKAREPVKMNWLFASFGCTLLAATASTLDLKRISCDPSNHWLQGHAVWHVLGSLSLFFSFLHHRQFDDAISRD
jgi:hypothetical protein